jgi:hypothetical protein
VNITGVTSPAAAPSGKTSISKYVNITKQNGDWILLNISYLASDVATITESTLELYKYNISGWSLASSTLDQANKVVYANLSSFSEFGLFGTTPSTGGGGGSGGGGGGGVSRGRTYTMSSNSQAFTLKRADKVVFTISAVQHTLSVLSVAPTQVVVQVASQPQQLSLEKGVPKEADLNNDGKNDVRVTLQGVSYYDASIRVELIGVECIENWICDPWSSCANSRQARGCTDTKACGTIKSKPKTEQECTPAVPEQKQEAPESPPDEDAQGDERLPVQPEALAGQEGTPLLDYIFYGLAILALVALGIYLYCLRRGRK